MDIFSDEFAAQAMAAGNRARIDALARSVPVFYEDPETGLDVMHCPDGRRFEIRFIPNAPDDRNYEIVREIAAPAA